MGLIKRVLARGVSAWSWLAVLLLAAAPAWAVGGIAERTAEETASRVVQILNDVVRPMGAMVIFGAIAYTAYKMIATAHKPEERAQTLGAIPYILGGAIIIGGIMLFAGFVVGLMMRAGQ